jgi:signal peptidase II
LSTRGGWTRWLVTLLVAGIVVALDQWTKYRIEQNIPLGGSLAPFPALEPWFKLVHWTNTGAAFGLLRGQAPIFIAIALVVIVAVLIYARQLPADSWAVRICLGLMLGGATGNLIDRLHQSGHVTDFLLFSLPVGDRVYEWPAWNVADASIVVGTILLGILLLRSEQAKAPVPTS